MSVILHLAAAEDWERASRGSLYTAASLHDHGFVDCATAPQHAAVANARFAGRGDLVLLRRRPRALLDDLGIAA